MTDLLHVDGQERETLRVFALDLPNPDVARVSLLLGGVALDPDHVELFPARDLVGVGLADYIIDGLGVSEADVAPDQARLDAETAHILILHARAFRDATVTLEPQPGLRPLGLYRLAQAAPPAITPPAAPSTVPAPPAATPPPGPLPRLSGRLALLSLLTVAVIVLVAAFLIGSNAP